MKRNTMIVIFSVVIITLLVVLIWGISVRDGWNGWRREDASGWPAADLKSGVVFEYDAADVQEVNIDLLSEEVQIEPAEGSTIRVEQLAASDIPSREQIRCGLRGSSLTVQAPAAWNASCVGWGHLPTSVRVSVPKQAALRLGIDVLSGSVNARDLRFRDMDVDAASGSIRLEGITADGASFQTASGSISIAGGSFRSLNCETASGEIDAETGVDGTVSLSSMSGGQRFSGSCSEFHAEAASGDVDAEIRGASSVSAEAMSGRVNLVCPDVSRLSLVRAETASGAVSLAFPRGTSLALDFESMSGRLNTAAAGELRIGSGIQVEVETASGDLTVRSLPA